MDERRQLLERFDQHEMPDLWSEIRARSLRPDRIAEGPPRTMRSPQRRHPVVLLAIVAAALGVAVLGVMTLWSNGPPTPDSARTNARLVAFTTGDGEITARITDPLAAASQLSAVFEEHGLNITVKAIPVSPSLVGRIVYSDVPSIRSLHEGTCLGGGTTCDVGLVIPADFQGEGNVVVGRGAQSDETFHSSADVFGPGEILHCSGILGGSVTDALPVLREKGLTVRWSGSSEGDSASAPSGYVADGTALSPTEVMLDITPTAPDWPDFRSFEALANKGC
jgi:hypothetical protein